jgi:hypothetical protein
MNKRTAENIRSLNEALRILTSVVMDSGGQFSLSEGKLVTDALEQAVAALNQHSDWLLSDYRDQ